MRGVGGPLLCIGDLLNDVGEEGISTTSSPRSPFSPSSSSSVSLPNSNSDFDLQPGRLVQLFQENYDRLNDSLTGTDHSWTALTLKLCTALDTANKLVQATNTHVGLLSEKVTELEGIVKRGDSAIEAAKSIQTSLNKVPSTSQNSESFTHDHSQG